MWCVGELTQEYRQRMYHLLALYEQPFEIGVPTRQCLDRRLGDRATLGSEVAAWQRHRNDQRKTIEWTFTRQDADLKLALHYVPLFTC